MKTGTRIFLMAATAVLATVLGVGAGYWRHSGEPSGQAGGHATTDATNTPAASGADAQSALAPSPVAADAVTQLFNAQLTDPAGKPETLAPYRGHVLVVNFWASWCGPCVQEMPTLARLSQQYEKKGVQFIGIGVDSTKNIQAFLQKIPVDYPIFVGGFGGADLARGLGNGPGALPFTVVIDAKGTVRSTKLGQISPDELQHALDAL
jgi:thiol-disulfide isomerase/thioredoxin